MDLLQAGTRRTGCCANLRARQRAWPVRFERAAATKQWLANVPDLNKKVFDAQLGFNLLPCYGEDAPEQLQDMELRIEKHLVSLLGRKHAVMPSLKLIQAPVFHGYSFSIWMEYQTTVTPKAIAVSLASDNLEIRSADLEAPSNVGSTGQPGVTVGLIESDRHNPRALWMWAVADNFRLRVDTAIAIAQGLQS
ncbi:MAG: Asd/ArgC dimerization domain-containing protein [Bryobacteraceae bacterium]